MGGYLAKRWPYRLAPYFNYEYAGVAVVNDSLVDYKKQATPAMAEYIASVQPSLGLNTTFVGGNYSFHHSEPQVDKDVETYGSFCVTRLGQAVKASEAEAGHLGFSVERTKNVLIVVAAAGVGACVAFTGIIGFVGLVVPHLVRLWIGPDHRWLLPGSALLGAIILTLADTIARYHRRAGRTPHRCAYRRVRRAIILVYAPAPASQGSVELRCPIRCCAPKDTCKVGVNSLVTDVNFALGAREVVAVLGPNGAGKSTLLKLLCGQLRPTTGSVSFDGKSI